MSNLKRLIYQALTSEFETSLRQKLNEMVQVIVTTSFPMHFEEAVLYTTFVAQQFATDIANQVFSLSQENYKKLSTIKKIFQALALKRVNASRDVFEQFITRAFPPLIIIWDYFSTIFSQANPSTISLKLNMIVDSIFVFSLRIGTPQVLYENDNLNECIKRLLQRSAKVLQYFRANEKALFSSNSDDYAVLEKHCLVLSYDLSLVQNLSALSFSEFLGDYIDYTIKCMNMPWISLEVKRGCLLMFYRNLREHKYYTSTDQLLNMGLDQKLKIDLQRQKVCNEAYYK
jgi:hypothetical protein